jgi:hypothetical protein
MKDLLPPVASLSKFLDQTSVIWNERGDIPLPNSQADLEVKSFQRPEAVVTAYTQAGMLFESAADYTMALIKTLTEPAQTIAPWGCARSVVEASVLATWLWDSKVNAHQRVQRSLAFRHEGLLQQLKLAKISKGRLDQEKTISRIKEVERTALEFGMAKISNIKGRKGTALDLKMPTITDIVTQTFDKEQNYRMLSAMIHGHSWAIQSLGFTVALKNQEIFKGVKGAYLKKNLGPSSIGYLCIEAVTSLSSAILMKYRLFGWDARPMAIIINSTQKDIGKFMKENPAEE